MKCFYFIVSLVLLINPIVYAQGTKAVKVSKVMEDSQVKILSSDLIAQIPATKDCKLLWELKDYGFQASYNLGYENHISLYSKEGIYMETLKKTPWNESIPPTLKMGFDSSDYGLYPVVSYWKNISLDTNDYFLELTDTDGKSKKVWADSNGNFFESPLFVK